MSTAKRCVTGLLLVASATTGKAVLVLGPAPRAASLAVSPDEVPAGVPATIDITGDGFGGCAEPSSGDTSVRVRWDGAALAFRIEPAGYGHFSVTARVPSGRAPTSAVPGRHILSAECAGPQAAPGLRATAAIVLRPRQSIRLSAAEAMPGDTVTVTGDKFVHCLTEPKARGASWARRWLGHHPVWWPNANVLVRLLFDGGKLRDRVKPTGDGHFAAAITVPAHAAPGDHVVAAECYDPTGEDPPSGVLAQRTLRVLGAVATTTPPPSTPTPPPPTTAPPTPTVAPPTVVPPTVAPPATPTPRLPAPAATSNWPALGGAIAIAAGALLAVFLIIFLGSGKRRRGSRWAAKHVTALGHPADAAATVERRPDGPSISISLRPHTDRRQRGEEG